MWPFQKVYGNEHFKKCSFSALKWAFLFFPTGKKKKQRQKNKVPFWVPLLEYLELMAGSGWIRLEMRMQPRNSTWTPRLEPSLLPLSWKAAVIRGWRRPCIPALGRGIQLSEPPDSHVHFRLLRSYQVRFHTSAWRSSNLHSDSNALTLLGKYLKLHKTG